jgi:tetratricopeptide (TPR) repeat protein
MTDETVVDNAEPEPPPLASEPITAKPEAKTFGVGWRIAIVLLAVIIVGFFVYPLIQGQPAENNTGDTTALSSAEEYFRLGNSHYEAGQWDQAVTAYKQAIAMDPNYQPAYANLGVTYYQQQQFELAVSQYKKALELDPNDGEVAYNLGALYVQQALSSPDGQPDLELLNQAVEQLNTVVEGNPDLAEPHFTLGVAYLALDKRAEATEAFETFLSLDTSGQGSQARTEAERYLQLLQGQ